jgi:nucleoside-diphosphate-sugar epimerase
MITVDQNEIIRREYFLNRKSMREIAKELHHGRPIKVFNYGRMRRDFTYIDDIISGVLAALTVPGLAPYEIINLGNHQAEDLGKVIALLGKELKVKARQDLLPIQPGDVPETFANPLQILIRPEKNWGSSH